MTTSSESSPRLRRPSSPSSRSPAPSLSADCPRRNRGERVGADDMVHRVDITVTHVDTDCPQAEAVLLA
ncbi:hypothetical protein MC885_004822 [Smutsia gigantea]|nr:hypothetical protein MC885_004822 [Smutsia gigantea]